MAAARPRAGSQELTSCPEPRGMDGEAGWVSRAPWLRSGPPRPDGSQSGQVRPRPLEAQGWGPLEGCTTMRGHWERVPSLPAARQLCPRWEAFPSDPPRPVGSGSLCCRGINTEEGGQRLCHQHHPDASGLGKWKEWLESKITEHKLVGQCSRTRTRKDKYIRQDHSVP